MYEYAPYSQKVLCLERMGNTREEASVRTEHGSNHLDPRLVIHPSMREDRAYDGGKDVMCPSANGDTAHDVVKRSLHHDLCAC